MKTPIKPSTARLLALLPVRFIIRVDVVQSKDGDCKPCGASVLDGDGKATTLDVQYPGFMTNLERLRQAGIVIHVADAGRPNPAKPGFGFIERHFIVCAPTPAPKNDSPAS